jgi:hypothetical protein
VRSHSPVSPQEAQSNQYQPGREAAVGGVAKDTTPGEGWSRSASQAPPSASYPEPLFSSIPRIQPRLRG